MNVIFFSVNLAKGGAENQLVKLAVNLKNKGYEVKIISIGKDNDFYDLLNNHDISINLISLNYGFGLFNIIGNIKQFNADVLISFMFPSNIIARLISLFVNVKIITSVRASKISFLYRIFYRLTYHLDDVSTFNSEIALKNMIDMKISDPAKSVVINNAVSLPFKNKRKNDKIFSLISIAHFRDNEKDYKTLFKALKIVKSKNHKFKVYIIGRLFNQSWPIKMINDFSLSKEIMLLGFVNNPEIYLKKSDALILSTFGESSPNAILEAMSFSIPVIASNVYGCDKIIKNSKGGLLSQPKDPNDLASKIISLINMSDVKRKSIGNNGFNYVKNNFSEDSIFNFWEKIICQ